MKTQLLLACVFLGTLTYAQVGINTITPKATLDVTSKNIDGTSPEGIIPPRLTGDALFAAIASNSYNVEQNGAIVYITTPAAAANQT
ncbi:hypothetical protein, partial [Bacillus sp. SIMBA_005]|uniref:hypothetical protein n=1 Tax=Bacillus sp. SIMBA_005 TaxID=3085754 RepID=UPI00397E2A83